MRTDEEDTKPRGAHDKYQLSVDLSVFCVVV